MQGPYERLKYDFRRLWECPVCSRRERWPGEDTTRLCPCQSETPPLLQRWMRLVEEGGRRMDGIPPPHRQSSFPPLE